MLNNTLIELMQNVGWDRKERVGIREVLPVRFVDRLDPSLRAGLPTSSGIGNVKSAENSFEVAKGMCLVVVPQLSGRHLAAWTLASLHRGDEDLLRVVTNVSGEDRVAASDDTVSAGHLHPSNTGCLKGRQDLPHARMEKVRAGAATCSLVGNVLEAGCWKVG